MMLTGAGRYGASIKERAMTDAKNVRTHKCGCICGDVRFEADFDLAAPVSRCNCRACVKRQVPGAMLKPSAFRLVAGDGCTSAWKTAIGETRFCKRCGIHVFGRGHLPELGGDFVSVNVSCVDDVDPATLSAIHWDGRHDNWDAGPRPSPWPVHAG
jgi:hypothetical protein